jgi:hypothetical protein
MNPKTLAAASFVIVGMLSLSRFAAADTHIIVAAVQPTTVSKFALAEAQRALAACRT